MRSDLTCDVFEILLIHHEDDHEKAIEFQDYINGNWPGSAGGTKNKRVMLENDIHRHVDNPAMALDLGCKRALVIFLLVTQKFCEKDVTTFTGYVCLKNFFKENRGGLYNVFTEKKEKMESKGYKLPIMLEHLHHVNFWRDSCFKEVREIIKAKLGDYGKMMHELQLERQLYIKENKEGLEEKRRILSENF